MTEMLETLIGSSVYDPGGAKIGKVKRVYVDNNSGVPTWVAVSTGLFSPDALVPLVGAEHSADSATLQVQVEKDAVKAAPQVDRDGQISPQAEQELFDHYQIEPDDGIEDDYDDSVLIEQTGRADSATSTRERWDIGAEQEEIGVARMRAYLERGDEALQTSSGDERLRLRNEAIAEQYVADLGDRLTDGAPDPERRGL
ncbi:PRC-barrel domain-containing protein [Nocardia sp. CNY236]|uniref:PRC-barrel domain-containing protein n=1 Tax=Nocardia sp. CNY236 TaxID=1169152 RepID=UPI0003FC2783|nr:PRC-barrel domain-containing protein [Nocardia sp. CNY236]